MGWFWGSNDANTSSDDPYKKLDPALRDLLDKESPLKYTPSATRPVPTQSSDAAPNEYRSQLGISSSNDPPNPQDAKSASAVPTESLYQDGRYAHLWKNYKPLSQVEGERSDQDRIADVIDAYNGRKAMIGRAAVENCVFEQLAERDCFVQGGWNARMTMCREENKAFNRCYVMQSRFLKALGYLSMDRTADEEERIQMHADKLYQQMLVREKAIAEAAKEGRPEPVYKPLLNERSVAEALGVKKEEEKKKKPTGLEMFSPEKRADIEKSLVDKTPMERELEIQLRVAESQASLEYANQIKEYYEEDKQKRLERKDKGKATFGDSIKSMWGWDK